MCGRAYSTYTDEELEDRYFNQKVKKKPLFDVKPNYNLSPTQQAPVVLVRDGKRQLELFRWGLVPFWAKDVKSADKYSLINAKAEEITEKRSYKQAFEKRRCLVPVSGFFEWRRDGDGPKRPFAIHRKNEPILSLAGVWEHWESPDGKQEVNSFSILTTSANSFMKKIHLRMPVILSPEDEDIWLDPENHDVEALQKLTKPCPSAWLEAYEVSQMVNSPKNNRPEVLKPLGESGD